MKDKKNIDRLFQEKFKDFEAFPDPSAWENISQRLHPEERKKRILPLWWRWSGAAAVLVLFLGIGNYVFKNESVEVQTKNTTVNTEISSPSSTKNRMKEKTGNDHVPNELNHVANNQLKDDSLHSSHKASNSKKIKSQNTTVAVSNTATKKLKVGTEITKSPQALKQPSKQPLTIFEKTNNPSATIAQNTSANSKDTLEPFENSENDHEINNNLKSHDSRYKLNPLISSKEDLAVEVDNNITTTELGESIEEAIAKANPRDEKEKEEQPNRWNITPNVAPVYFNTLSKGSPIDAQFVKNGKSGEVNMSYGINGSYALNDKIKIRTGINKVDLGYSTNDVVAFSEVSSFNTTSQNRELKNINPTNRGASTSYLSTSNINSFSAPEFVVADSRGSLEQEFGYIEVPLEVEYSIINQRFGMHVVGGFSTLFLNKNEVFSVSETDSFLLGEANNINTTSYSANFGIGFNYEILPKIQLNLEPMFKYQLNTFTNTAGDFRPYFIGVYTGVSFKF